MGQFGEASNDGQRKGSRSIGWPVLLRRGDSWIGELVDWLVWYSEDSRTGEQSKVDHFLEGRVLVRQSEMESVFVEIFGRVGGFANGVNVAKIE